MTPGALLLLLLLLLGALGAPFAPGKSGPQRGKVNMRSRNSHARIPK